MSTNDPGFPLQGLLGDLLKLIGAQSGGVAWMDSARALAQGVATEGEPEPNPDPLERIALEELARAAELHVAQATGLEVASGGRPVQVAAVGRGEWALRTLDAWAPLLETIVASQEPPPIPAGPGAGAHGGPAGPGDLEYPGRTGEAGGMGGLADLLSQFAGTMGPVLLGMQFGSAAGHLALRAMGQYAVPLPRRDAGQLLVIPRNIDRFAEDWSLPVDQARLWVCIHELTAHAVLSLPHVAQRITALVEEVAADSSVAQQGLMERLLGEAGDPESLQGFLSDPESLLADLVTPGQQRTSEELIALTGAVEGYVDHVTDQVAGGLTGSAATLREAWYRYRISDDAAQEQGAAALFGLDISRAQVDRGLAFVRGVVERAGSDGLARLWSEPRNLPTPAEVDAPGLWLARIDIPDEGGADPTSAGGGAG